VLNVTGIGPNVVAAARTSRAACERIGFEGKTYRRDIAHRELERAGAS
jgi:phosphoribosylamine-glycine ligase